ncbi:MAG: hypothetical protein P0Y64_13065 [Candidatus Sphingomonas colombiensis]|nr:hypothetical protein [Sphingomonas sp.]WEK42318.1 MAG: hypothetical protein P0Y64_13065 [Sphingomonas sp.]
MTIEHDDTTIERIALGLIDRSLPKPEWTHAAHFAAALWLLRHRPALTAPGAIREVISGYNAATGTPNTDEGGYHHTITLASMRAASAWLHTHPATISLSEILAHLLASPFGKPDWLLAYWSRSLLFTPEARHGWIEPDLASLPF